MASLVTEPAGVLDPFEYASDFVRSYCGQQFDFVASDTVVIDPRNDGTGQLPQMPVSNVESISAYMMDTAGNLSWQTLTQWGFNTRGLVYDLTQVIPPTIPFILFPSWPYLPQSLQVTYDHGYSVIPQDIQDVVTRLAMSVQANPMFSQSVKIGDLSTVFGALAQQSGGGPLVTLRDMDAVILDRYKVIEVG